MSQPKAVFATALPVFKSPPGFSLADAPPGFIIAALAILVVALNAAIPLTWVNPAYKLLWPSLAFFAIAVVCHLRKRERAIVEIPLYLGYWMFYPSFLAKLTYFAARARFPLQDKLFLASDAAMGFHWVAWVPFLLAHPLLLQIQTFAYGSTFWQPLLAIPLLTLLGPPGRNSEFLTVMLFGGGLTTLTFMLLPTLGPLDMAGVSAPSGKFIHLLRSGFDGPYQLGGIISFPSFHIVMAILDTAIYRGIRVLQPLALALNLVMLSAIPHQGDHYLSDLIAGAAIAIVSIAAARILVARLSAPAGAATAS